MLLYIIMAKVKKMLNKEVVNLVLLLIILVILVFVLRNTYSSPQELFEEECPCPPMGAGPMPSSECNSEADWTAKCGKLVGEGSEQGRCTSEGMYFLCK